MIRRLGIRGNRIIIGNIRVYIGVGRRGIRKLLLLIISMLWIAIGIGLGIIVKIKVNLKVRACESKGIIIPKRIDKIWQGSSFNNLIRDSGGRQELSNFLISLHRCFNCSIHVKTRIDDCRYPFRIRIQIGN